MSNLSDFVVFNDDKLAKKYADIPVPVSVLYEGYFDGEIDITGDIFEFLRERHSHVKYTITRQHLQWAVTNFVPDMVHSKSQDEKMLREVYDRGNDFFEWFLGPSMIYAAGRFASHDESLEDAQDRQVKTLLSKLDLHKGQRLLDIGCGWGSLLRDAIRDHDVNGVGVTVSDNQTAFASQQLKNANLSAQGTVLCQDYRDIESETRFDRIVCVEMIEHVGLKNLSTFCERVHQLLEDDGLFVLQWTGVRRSLKQEDLMWGLFMNKYITPGADATLAPSSMLKSLEKAGFELQNLENITGHYAQTLLAWHQNWRANREAIVAAYGERWFRIWNFFLAWSYLVAQDGIAGSYQAVLRKNVPESERSSD